ncbi:MAG: hypothetical protein ACKO24_04720 [Leptolyngbyaceae cyanobacterium]
MLKKTTFLGILVGAGFLLGTVSERTAAEVNINNLNSHTQTSSQLNQFQQIKHSAGIQIVVTIGGLGLIGLELWWFLFSKPPSKHK